MAETINRPRRVWLALLFSLLGCPLGHVYCGFFQRALVFWVVGMILVPAVSFCCVTFPLNQAGFIACGLSGLSFPIIQSIDAVRLARRRPTMAKKFYQRWWVYLGLFIACYPLNFADAYFTKTYIAEGFKITSRAMAPTLVHGDRVVVDKFWTTPKRLTRNSLVVYRNAEDGALHLMRLVAVPGDEVRMVDGRFLLNGEDASVPEAHFEAEAHRDMRSSGRDINNLITKVPNDSFFVLGDNRNLSLDSRYVGSIPNERLYGTVKCILWSRPLVLTLPYGPMPLEPAENSPIAWWRIGLPL